MNRALNPAQIFNVPVKTGHTSVSPECVCRWRARTGSLSSTDAFFPSPSVSVNDLPLGWTCERKDERSYSFSCVPSAELICEALCNVISNPRTAAVQSQGSQSDTLRWEASAGIRVVYCGYSAGDHKLVLSINIIFITNFFHWPWVWEKKRRI